MQHISNIFSVNNIRSWRGRSFKLNHNNRIMKNILQYEYSGIRINWVSYQSLINHPFAEWLFYFVIFLLNDHFSDYIVSLLKSSDIKKVHCLLIICICIISTSQHYTSTVYFLSHLIVQRHLATPLSKGTKYIILITQNHD